MKKNYIITLILLLLSSLSFAQNNISSQFSVTEAEASLSSKPNDVDPDFLKKRKFNQKAFGNTIIGSDFDFNGGTQGWTIVNNMANNFQWQWATTYQNGMFSAPGDVITSTTAANGFMSLPMDFFNTPIPPGPGPVTADTYIESPTINLTNNGANPNGFGTVWATYEQTMRYCCSSANRLVLQVSSDNFLTFQEYDATNAIAVNAASGTFTNVIDITTAAANQTSIKLRFLSEGNSHYYWMIDDFSLIEGPDTDLELIDAYPEFNADNYVINPFYSQIPLDLFTPLYFSGIVINRGAQTSTNTRLEVSVTNDSLRNTPLSQLTTGLGMQYFNTQATVPSSLLTNSFDTVIVGLNNRYVPTALGKFTIDFLANSDSINQIPANAVDSFSFEFTNRTMAKDDGGLSGLLSPANFVRNGMPGGTASGDKLATMFIIEPNVNAFSQTPKVESISFLVSLDPSNIGAEILPKLYPFNATAATLPSAIGSEVASSFLPYTVQAADLGNWITVAFDNGTGFSNGLQPGQYFAGWEATSITGASNFSVQQDQSSGSKQPNLTTIIDFGHSPGWGTIAPTTPGIRLNFDSTSVPLVTSISSIANSKASFLISPNPNNGIFTIDITTNSTVTYRLNVRNTLGQLVHSKPISINHTLTKQLDLGGLEKGVYFVSLENETGKTVKKIIIK